MQERLLRLDAHVGELQRFRERYTSDDVRRDRHLEWALRTAHPRQRGWHRPGTPPRAAPGVRITQRIPTPSRPSAPTGSVRP